MQDLEEDEEVELGTLKYHLQIANLRPSHDDLEQYPWYNIHMSHASFERQTQRDVFQRSVDRSLLDLKLSSTKGILTNIAELELDMLQRMKAEDLEFERDAEFEIGTNMPALKSINQIQKPDFDFHETVFKMEQQFIELEETIDPIETGQMEHV